MKKAKSHTRKTAAKSSGTPKSIDEYLARVPEPARDHVNSIRSAIRSTVPREAIEIISYGIPAFKGERVLVWYAGFAKHCSLFPTASVIEEFKDELKGFATSKGTIQFPLDKPLPIALIKKVVRARIAQNETKKR